MKQDNNGRQWRLIERRPGVEAIARAWFAQ